MLNACTVASLEGGWIIASIVDYRIMRATTILSLVGSTAAAASSSSSIRGEKKFMMREQFERELSGSGDLNFDDDFWAYDQGEMETVWDDYSMEPKKCMI